MQYLIDRHKRTTSQMNQIFSIATIPVLLSILAILVVIQPPPVHAHSISLEQVDQSESRNNSAHIFAHDEVLPMGWFCGGVGQRVKPFTSDEMKEIWIFSSLFGVLTSLLCLIHSVSYERALSKTQIRYGLHSPQVA